MNLEFIKVGNEWVAEFKVEEVQRLRLRVVGIKLCTLM